MKKIRLFWFEVPLKKLQINVFHIYIRHICNRVDKAKSAQDGIDTAAAACVGIISQQYKVLHPCCIFVCFLGKIPNMSLCTLLN